MQLIPAPVHVVNPDDVPIRHTATCSCCQQPGRLRTTDSGNLVLCPKDGRWKVSQEDRMN